MLLIFMAFGAFFDNFIALMELLFFPFIAVGEAGNRIINKISGAFDSEE